MLLLFLAIAQSLCPANTNTYKKFGNSVNANNRYYIEDTYNARYNLCKSTKDIDFANVHKFACRGMWCNNNTWACNNTDYQCYTAGHIISANNNLPELKGCDANIFGNTIMMYEQWYVEAGNGFLCEKQEVFQTYYVFAYNAMLECCSRTSEPMDMAVLQGILATLAVMTIIIGVVACCCTETRN